MEYIFQSNFLIKFKHPDADKFISELERVTLDTVDDYTWSWGDYCKVDRVVLSGMDLGKYFRPIMNRIGKELNYSGGMGMDIPWLNFYKKHGFQEVHDHYPADLAMVFFVNEGKDFSGFYVKDRNNTNVSMNLTKVLNQFNGYDNSSFLNVSAGDVLIFPGSMLHGVSAHGSDIMRKTLSTNIYFTK